MKPPDSRVRYIPRSPGTGEYRIVKISEVITDGCDCYPWHEVFAWWPVKTITGKRLWWTKVYKRKVWLVWGSSFHMEPEVQYATAFELLTHNDNKL